MRLVSVVGARPQFVKLAPLADAALRAGVDHRIVHTGQHYDPAMSDGFFEHLEIPAPDVNLAVGSGTHGAQTGAMLTAIEPVLEELEPDWVLVYGDTNSTLAAALAAVKLHLPLAHLEAGLRSYNRRMPEEHNRVLTDHAADLCLAPTERALRTLSDEGLGARSVLVGDVMVDVLQRFLARDRPQGATTPPQRPYVLATIHRAENTDDGARLGRIVDALASLDVKVVLPMHPRLRARCEEHRIEVARGALRPVPPMTYPDLVHALSGADAVVTDSGGLQKEAYVAGVPTATLRTETEWEETLRGGWNVLVSDPERLVDVLGRPTPTEARGNPFGGGTAAQTVLEVLRSRS